MASLVHPSGARQRPMAVLKAYVDESGFEGPIFVLCGFLATDEKWKEVEDAWQRLLDKPCEYEIETKKPISPEALCKICRPLEYLHATEMEGMGTNRFRRIGQRNRTYLINESVRIMLGSGIVGVGTGIVLSVYDGFPEHVKQAAKSPYLMCMRYLLSEFAKRASMFLGEEAEDIAYIFDDQRVWELKAHALYSELKTVFCKEYRMGALGFAPMLKFKPLQVSDRLAFETFQHLSNPTFERPHWERIANHPLISGNYCEEVGGKIIFDNFARSMGLR